LGLTSASESVSRPDDCSVASSGCTPMGTLPLQGRRSREGSCCARPCARPAGGRHYTLVPTLDTQHVYPIFPFAAFTRRRLWMPSFSAVRYSLGFFGCVYTAPFPFHSKGIVSSIPRAWHMSVIQITPLLFSAPRGRAPASPSLDWDLLSLNPGPLNLQEAWAD
jgi:hypothetical protein